MRFLRIVLLIIIFGGACKSPETKSTENIESLSENDVQPINNNVSPVNIHVDTSGSANLYIEGYYEDTIEDFAPSIKINRKVEPDSACTMMVGKPMIYLYPTESQEIEVKLSFDGQVEFTYPDYRDGWKIKAEPDGTLFDKTGKEYYALFWEGIPNEKFTMDKGNVVPGEKTIDFLESSLSTLGLNRREMNEFIVYWLPELEKNPYNLIHFSESEYESMAILDVNPKPESIIRVMMVYKPLTEPIDIPFQDISKLKKERKGFTLVEWGGCMQK